MITTQSIVSIGRIAQTVGFPVHAVLKACSALSITAELRLDGVPHYDERKLKQIETWLYNQQRNK